MALSPLCHYKRSLVPSVDEQLDLLLEAIYTGQTIHVGNYSNSPIANVKALVQRAYHGQAEPKPLFSEMYDLSSGDGDVDEYRWSESARWIKYEETVEEGGKRWSKPHVTLLSLPGLLQLRNCLKKGFIAFDAPCSNFYEVVDLIVNGWDDQNQLSIHEREQVGEILIAPKNHLVRSQFRDRASSAGEADGALGFGLRPADVDYGAESDMDDNQATLTSLKAAQLAKKIKSSAANGTGTTSQTKIMSAKEKMMRKVPKGSEAANIFIGKVFDLCQPMSAFVRLKDAVKFGDIPEVPIATRFVFVLLLPTVHEDRNISYVGKTLGVLFSDEVFSAYAYKCKEPTELYFGVDEFLSQTILIPSGRWSLDQRLDPNPKALVEREVGKPISRHMSVLHPHVMDDGLRRTGSFFGGLVQDLRRKVPFYWSDFRDAFTGASFMQCMAAAIFLFFTNITKIITFGGVMESMLHKNMAAMENLLSGGICGVIYALFSGQPLAVLSATGPTLVFEAILYRLCETAEWGFLQARFWVGVWTAVFIIILVATDASVVVGLITKFTEEAFATLISMIFIIQAFEELWHISYFAPITPASMVQSVIRDPCRCNMTYNNSVPVRMLPSSHGHHDAFPIHDEAANSFTFAILSNVTHKQECLDAGGIAQGLQCDFHPDVFPFSVVLFIGTFVISYGLKMFRHSGYLPCRVRCTIADFGVFIAIVLMTLLNYLVQLDVPTLNVPTRFRPTLDRSWFVDPMDLPNWWIPLAAAVPALFFTVLVVMDQQITSVIVNRKENKLKKGYGYHLDLLVIAVLMIVCSWMGIPYYVAATVISIMHVESLKTMTDTAAPGEKPQFLGVREQRVTALIAHILIGLAVFLTPVIKLVPVPVLLGIFLYTGVVALSGQQFIQRLALFFMPVKYQPDFKFLRLVPLRRVHLFTVIQLLSLIALFAVKYTHQISMLFPIMLVVMVFIRKLMDRYFKPQELLALDDPLPGWAELVRPVNQSYHTHVSGQKLSIVNNGKQTKAKKNRPELENHLLKKDMPATTV